VNYFRLSIIPEKRSFPGGVADLLRSDAATLDPPRWADAVVISETGDHMPDAVLLLIDGSPSMALRREFFQALRRNVPIAALCYGRIPEGDTVALEIQERDRLWTFTSAAEGRQLVYNQVQDWVKDLRRSTFHFPRGEELIASYGEIPDGLLNPEVYARASEVFRRRGFVCLSGSLGAGKTTLARKLLLDAAEEGLEPVEIIAHDLDVDDMERLLTGPEDCAILLDLDTMRRLVPIYPARLWSVILSMMIRTTESRRRLVLATSFTGIAELFDQYADAHVKLPEPTTDRQWRLQQGKEALEWYGALEPVEIAGLLLLAAFDPIIPEAIYKRTLFSLWERLLIMESMVFPSTEDLEQLYEGSLAARGIEPFRRISGGGEGYIAAADTVKMWAIDETIRTMLRGNAPVMRVLADTLFGSREPIAQRAGYFLAGFYRDLPVEMRTRLLIQIAGEKSRDNLQDAIHTLLSSPEILDTAVASLCRRLMHSESSQVRRTVAETLGMPWIVDSPELNDLVEATALDPEPVVRSRLLQGLTMWGMSEKGERIYDRLIDDPSPEVRSSALLHFGTVFPDLSERELSIVNSVMETGDPRGIRSLTWGLLDRPAEEYSQEFHDLLWILISKLSRGGKGRLAWQIGARLRFFRSEVRELLMDGLTEDDILPVTQCMLMNYHTLDASERSIIWKLINENVTGDGTFAGMVLGYYSIMDEDSRSSLVRAILVSGRHESLDALSQMISRGRVDILQTALDEVDRILSGGDVESRSWVPLFLLWNIGDLPPEGFRMLDRILQDPSPQIRKALARAAWLLGRQDTRTIDFLLHLSTDPERSVRAAAGEALGEFDMTVSTEVESMVRALMGDDDPFVRARTLAGVLESTSMTETGKTGFVLAGLEDSSPDVRLEALRGLEQSPALRTGPGVDMKLAEILGDSDHSVRLEAIKLVTGTPDLLISEVLKKKIPDILLDRHMAGSDIADELSMARKIQQDLLPDRPPTPERFDIEVFYRPAKEVGGDYYDFFTLPGRNLGIAIADVVGKGIPAALTMASLKGNLGAYVHSLYSINEIVARVNESSITSEGDPILTGLFYSVLEMDNGQLTYVNAGHNPPLLVRREGRTMLLETGGLILGLVPDAEYVWGREKLEPGDVLVLFTDGVTEAMDHFGEEYGIDRLKNLVLESRDVSARQIISRILDSVMSHSDGMTQGDDQTLVVLKYR
jgi:hypothetical protein